MDSSMSRIVARLAALGASFALGACGGSGDAPAPPVIGGPQQTTAVTVAGPGGSAITNPPKAQHEETPIALRTATAAEAPALPAGFVPAGPIVEITPHYASSLPQARVRVPFDAASSATGDDLVVWKANPGELWRVLEPAVRGEGVLEVDVDGLSLFVGVRRPTWTPAPQPNGTVQYANSTLPAALRPMRMYPAVLTDVRAISGWSNSFWALKGEPGTTGSTLGPVAVKAETCASLPCADNLTGVTALASGNGAATLALKNGQILGWGSRGSGLLGPVVSGGQSFPRPVASPGVSGFTALSASNLHALVIGPGNVVYAWGSGLRGALGDGIDGSSRTAPGMVSVP